MAARRASLKALLSRSWTLGLVCVRALLPLWPQISWAQQLGYQLDPAWASLAYDVWTQVGPRPQTSGGGRQCHARRTRTVVPPKCGQAARRTRVRAAAQTEKLSFTHVSVNSYAAAMSPSDPACTVRELTGGLDVQFACCCKPWLPPDASAPHVVVPRAVPQFSTSGVAAASLSRRTRPASKSTAVTKADWAKAVPVKVRP